jgi:hypothetical protein
MSEKYLDNQVRSGNFTLHVLATRTLSRDELLYAVAVYQKANKLKQLPASGSATIRFPVRGFVE